jgi:hypothetical protein
MVLVENELQATGLWNVPKLWMSGQSPVFHAQIESMVRWVRVEKYSVLLGHGDLPVTLELTWL